MTIDTTQLIAEAAPVLASAINSLTTKAMHMVDDAIGEGARIELRIEICDGVAGVTVHLCNLSGETVLLCRLGSEGH